MTMTARRGLSSVNRSSVLFGHPEPVDPVIGTLTAAIVLSVHHHWSSVDSVIKTVTSIGVMLPYAGLGRTSSAGREVCTGGSRLEVHTGSLHWEFVPGVCRCIRRICPRIDCLPSNAITRVLTVTE